jgi:hypothetical protein
MNCCLDCLTFLDYVQVLGNEKAAVEVLDLLLCMGMCLCLWYISRSCFYSCDDQAIRSHAQNTPSTEFTADMMTLNMNNLAHMASIFYERLFHVCRHPLTADHSRQPCFLPTRGRRTYTRAYYSKRTRRSGCRLYTTTFV